MRRPDDIRPPKWPLRFLRLFVKKEYLEEIEGDMEELFQENAAQGSYRRARRQYSWEILRLLRPILIKKRGELQPVHSTGMYKNYFKTSVRGMLKNPFTSFINLFGLAVAIGFCILVYGFARWTYGMDQFHKNKQEVYLATFFAKRDGTYQQFGRTPGPLGLSLKKDFGQIRRICRVEDRAVVVKSQDKVFNEQVRYTDPAFLEMFSFPLKWGTPKALDGLDNIILSEALSIKYFGKENPLGRQLLVKFDKDRSKSYTVGGVAATFPEARTFDFDLLLNFENLRMADPGYHPTDWNTNLTATLIQVDHPADVDLIQRGMGNYIQAHNAVAPVDWAISSFAFEPLATLNRKADSIRGCISNGSEANYKSVVFLIVLGIFMLVLACFNYINIAIVTATKRLKEIGLRKSMGATRGTVVAQFLYENGVTTMLALVLGLIFGAYVIIPWFETINHFSMGFRLADPVLWVYLPAILLVTAVASGLYPSLYISKFQVVGILKGSVRFGKKNPLTKVFLVLQLILACIFVTGAVMFSQNTAYLTHRSWGYNEHQALYVNLPDAAAYEKLEALLSRDPDVVSISGSVEHLGRSHVTAIVRTPSHPFEVDQLSVDARYFKTMGLQLAAGRVFADHSEEDERTIVVNNLLVQNLALKDPVGQMVRIDSIQYRIIGVLNDFYSHSFYTKMRPTIFRVADKDQYRYLSLQVRPGSEHKTYKTVQARWAELYPEAPFSGGFQEDVWGTYYEELGVHATVWRVIAFMAILLVSLGLYGLVKLNIAARVREFSIRKVLGAGFRNIADNIMRQYILLLIIALALGIPLSYTMGKMVLEFAYVYHMPISFSSVVLAVSILILIVLITLSTQIRKVLRANPVEGLKAE